ncbi:MAG: hypothetical protein E7375_04010 [Clostridiales bacterium]|nr:hypothetical protein [Clostridiales bacterium]
MSFYINNSNPNKPGAICGNPLNGICEKILIETTKVFDACVCTTTESGIILQVADFFPENPALPLTFVSAENTPNTASTISDLVVDRLDSCPNYANVSFNLTIPVTVTYRDANGVAGTALASLVVNKSVLLFVPQPAVTPINITAMGNFSSQIGTFTAPNTFTLTGCIQIIVKVVSVVDILIPSYGYPILPPCQQSPQNACPSFEDLPIYPSATTINNIPRV